MPECDSCELCKLREKALLISSTSMKLSRVAGQPFTGAKLRCISRVAVFLLQRLTYGFLPARKLSLVLRDVEMTKLFVREAKVAALAPGVRVLFRLGSISRYVKQHGRPQGTANLLMPIETSQQVS